LDWLPTGSSHLVITGHAPDGRQLWEINGLPTDPDGEPTGATVGALFDLDDTIQVHYETGEWKHGPGAINQRVVWYGGPDAINKNRNTLRYTGELINEKQIPYRATTTNSNASVWTLLPSIGFDPRRLFRYGGFKGNVPGFSRNLLAPEPRPKRLQPGDYR